ncbi:uncharacterized protein LOC133442095 isoform X2 [Cololabis saira]|uniref:uncharacterized protein LOC133442095 isoform X2 n=1 Tax=Cololabis saira TaxID=129043 RepID=UPI002AD42524|nr:uncharacterized protein LOC133442095 isoform X2 [Cololabis saira]
MAAKLQPEPGGRPWKRSSSIDLLPPEMSELRVVVLGSSWSQRNSVENFILEHSVSNTEPFSCTRNTSRFRNKHVTVINTPDLLSPTEETLNQFLKHCARVSDPGPHVFLLVLHPEDFNEEHKEKFCRILETYNHQLFDRCLVLVTPREKSSGLMETHMENPTLKEMIRKCRYRHLKMSDIDRSELLTRLAQVAKENNGEHLTYGVFEETTSPGYPRFLHSSLSGQRLSPNRGLSDWIFPPHRGRPWKRSSSLEILPPTMSELRIVVLGSSWSQRNSVENLILELSVFNTEPFSCTRNTSRFRNKLLTVINTPDLLSPTEDKLNEFLRDCARVSDPGPHVFLLVLKPEDFNEEHKEKFCRILETYNHQSFDRCLILVTPREESSGLMETHMENPTLKEMIRKCRYRHLKMSDIDRSELLTRLGQVVKENNGEHLTYGVSEETTSPGYPHFLHSSLSEQRLSLQLSSSSADSNREFFDTDGKEVKPGDLIEIYRGRNHWAVYVGRGNVVHFVEDGGGSSSSSSMSPMSFMSSSAVGVSVDGKVLKEKLQDVVKKDKWRVNNLLDHGYKPRPADDIVKEACSLEDTEKQYNLLTYNTEQFATDMRYGKPWSRQVKLAAGIKPATAAAREQKKRKRSLKLFSSSADSNREFFDTDQKEVKPGDLIQIYRGYQHWAVYVGRGNVVHFVGPGRGSSSSSSMASSSSMSFMSSSGVGVGGSVGKVLKEKLQDKVKKDRWRINNLLDHEYKPRPADVIVKEACSLVDTEKQYNLLTYNTKQFASEMRYGKPGSRQDKDAGIKPGAAEVEAATAAASEQKKRKTQPV